MVFHCNKCNAIMAHEGLCIDCQEKVNSPVGLRFNDNKARTDLLPYDVMWHISKVLEVGAKKYADRNWEKGMSWMTVVGCLTRHLFKWISGNEVDKETGLPHIDLVLINAVFLSRYYHTNRGTDDRPLEYMEVIND